MFGRKNKASTVVSTIEMMLDHDGRNWVLSGEDMKLRAPELDDLDRELEKALQPRLGGDKRVDVIMTTNNEMIPEWMRPYMNHYFNRHLELPLRY